jgi:predicted DNA binding CopG/RHH family protein
MQYLNWNPEKNEILKRERGISFEEIAYLIESGQVIGIEENPGYPNQKMYVLEIDNYAIIVPYVENDDEIFSKTAFLSRKYTKKIRFEGGMMNKIKKNVFKPIDQEEKDLMESIEHDEWQPVKNFDQERKKAIEAARNTLKKDKRINLRLSQRDYHQIQIKAIEEGIPYQTLISSIVHKYLDGSLVPRS